MKILRSIALVLVLAFPVAVQAADDYTLTTNAGAITITGHTLPVGALIIPSATNGLPVTTIGDGAFRDCTGLTSVTIGSSVTSIGEYAFQYCSSLTSVTIGSSVTSIGEYAFYNCSSLISVTIPNSVTSIGDGAFWDCTGLISIVIPDSVTSIGNLAFYSCTSLTSVTIGSSVTSIGEYAFYNCNSLTSVTIPNSVTTIGDGAFWGCSSLMGVSFNGNAPDYGPAVFTYANNVTVYYLPSTTGWDATFCGRPTMLWNPQVPASDGSFGVQSNQFGFNITGTSNLVVVVEACSNIANPVWFPVATNSLTNGTSYFSDSAWTNRRARFYRMRMP